MSKNPLLKMNPLDWIAISLLIIGGIAWAPYPFGINIVNILFGWFKPLEIIVYELVALSALYSIITFGKLIFKYYFG